MCSLRHQWASRCPRRVLLGLCGRKLREFLAQHQQLQRYLPALWSYKFKFFPIPNSKGLIGIDLRAGERFHSDSQDVWLADGDGDVVYQAGRVYEPRRAAPVGGKRDQALAQRPGHTAGAGARRPRARLLDRA